jgi:DNA-binding MarR family transcriptional regulator
MKWRAAVDRALSPIGLTHAQYSLLASLYGLSRTGTQPSQRELADFAGLEPIYVSKLARALETAGLLSRAEHPADPRAVQLALTAKGTDAAVQAVAVVRSLQEEITAPIGGTRSRQNRELTRTLKKLLDTPAPQGGNDKKQETTMTQTPTLTGQDIGEAQGALTALLERALAGIGSTSSEYIVLRVLAARGPFAPPAVLRDFLSGQRQLGLDQAAVAQLLARLEARGLVTGTSPGSPGPAQLTEDGVALHARLSQAVAPTTRQIFAGFDEDDLATAHRVLAEIVERARRLDGDNT